MPDPPSFGLTPQGLAKGPPKGVHNDDEYAYCIPNLYTVLVHQGKGTKYPR